MTVLTTTWRNVPEFQMGVNGASGQRPPHIQFFGRCSRGGEGVDTLVTDCQSFPDSVAFNAVKRHHYWGDGSSSFDHLYFTDLERLNSTDPARAMILSTLRASVANIHAGADVIMCRHFQRRSLVAGGAGHDNLPGRGW